MPRDSDAIVLKSGKTFYANHQILGIATPGNEVDGCIITEGYDGTVNLTDYNGDTNDYTPRFTRFELYNIADIAIERWNQFKRDVANGKVPQK